jgi:phosphoglycerate dehydrogenase-like enzyme
LLAESDFVVNSTPLTPDTLNYWNEEKFRKMKKSAVFMSIGRGPTVNEDDLVKCLKNGTIAGAVMDVFKTEPLPRESELWKLSNVYITPHCCDVTEDYHDRSV